MNKNEEYIVTIEDIGTDGEGIGHIIETASKYDSHANKDSGKSGINGALSGREKGVTCFVKDTVVGDEARIKIIKVKKNYVYGRLMEIINPSPYRVEALCPKSRSCGGCTLMHMSYEKQLEYKFNKVKNCLERIGGLEDAEKFMEPIYGMEKPYHYRNKMQFPIGIGKNGKVNIGFYAGRTHSIIDIDECVTGHKINTFIIKNLRTWISAKFNQDKSFVYNEELHRGLFRHIVTRIGYVTGELSVCMVINGDGLSKKLCDELVGCLMAAVDEYNESEVKTGQNATDANCLEEKSRQNAADDILEEKSRQSASDANLEEKLNQKDIDKNWEDKTAESETQVLIKLSSVSLNINKEKTNKILGDKTVTIYGRDYIKDYIGDICFNISPQSFFQVNPIQTKILYDKALSYAGLTGNETVWDMYCGIGTISLFLAQKAKKVYGVEIIPKAIEDAKENARFNKFDNTEFYCGKAEEVVPELYRENGIKPDVIVVDPPRKGCDISLLDTISDMSPERLVYVSCDPATLARDIKYLGDKGFKVKKVAVVDQFCHSMHVETVCLLSQRKPDTTIEVDLDISELEVSSAETKATYEEIKSYVLKKYGLKVSNLYIAQVKRECGIVERINYNLPKTEGNRVPQCPEDKRKAIKDAFIHFQMI